VDINQSWLLKGALGFFMAPYLLFALTWGDFDLYRAFQIVWVILLFLAILLYPSKTSQSSSFHALTISGVLLLSSLVAIISDLSTDHGLDTDLLMKTAMFVAVILLIDRFRVIGFDAFMSYSLPAAIVMVIVTSVHFAVNPEIVYGRYLFFGLQPNLGGELLLGCAIIVMFARSLALRWIVGTLILVLLMLLQSRAALLGTFLVMMLGEALRALFISDGPARRQLIGLTLSVAGVSLFVLLIFDPLIISRIAVFVYSDVLLMDNIYRGVGSGLVGREDTWWNALSVFTENPFFGVGLDRVTSEDDLAIHSGYLALLAQFGILSIGFFIILALGLIESIRQRSIRVAVIIACMFVFTVNARSVNLNVFPLILWLACLPWTDRPRQTVPQTFKPLAST
jgi:O-antigen ligase